MTCSSMKISLLFEKHQKQSVFLMMEAKAVQDKRTVDRLFCKYFRGNR